MDKQNEIAEKHWQYVESLCHKMYVDGFIHGYKHGLDERELLKLVFKEMK